MAHIDNSETKKEINDAIRGNAVSNIAPSQVSSNVQLVCETNPKLLRRCNIVKEGGVSNSTGATIYTTPADKDFYLTAFTFSLIKDATSTSTTSTISCVIDGATQILAEICGLTLTAQSQSIGLSFPIPIKLDRGSLVRVTNTTNIANVKCTATLIGYTVEN